MNYYNLALASLISGFGILLSLLNIKNDSGKKINNILFLILITLEMFLSKVFLKDIMQMMVNFTLLFVFTYLFITNKNINNGLVYSLFIFLLMALIEIILSVLLNLVVNFNNYYSDNINISIIIFSTLISLFMFLITKVKFIKKAIDKISLNDKVIFIFIVFLIILSVLIIENNKIVLKENDLSILINVFIYLSIIFGLFLVIYLSYKKNIIYERYNQTLDFVEEYEKIIDEQGKRNHEFNNQLLVIYGYLNNKKELKNYLDSITKDHKTGQNYFIRQLSRFPNGGLKGLLYYKISKMKDNNIKYYLYVSNDIKKKLKNIDIKKYKDITKVFGVLLDNAIEAATESKDKEVVMDFKVDGNYIIFNISNTYDKKDDLNNVGTKRFTTKGLGHGFGLSLVKDIIKNNNYLDLSTSFTEKEFIQTFLIDLK